MCQRRSGVQQIRKVKGVEGLSYEVINESDWNAHQNAGAFNDDNQNNNCKYERHCKYLPILFWITCVWIYWFYVAFTFTGPSAANTSSICRRFLPIDTCNFMNTFSLMRLVDFNLLTLSVNPQLYLNFIMLVVITYQDADLEDMKYLLLKFFASIYFYCFPTPEPTDLSYSLHNYEDKYDYEHENEDDYEDENDYKAEDDYKDDSNSSARVYVCFVFRVICIVILWIALCAIF